MDIYSYLESSDIAEHCRKIGHIFTSSDMATIIDLSKKTLKEKHSAWREIISDYPDMPIKRGEHFDAHDSIHDFLRELISCEEKTLEELYKTTDKAIYRPYVWRDKYINSDIEYPENDNGSYSTFEKAWAEISDWKENYDNASIVTIKKEYLDDGDYIRAVINYKGEITNISTNLAEFNEFDHSDLWTRFADIPVPFEEGDLVEYDGKPYVVTYLPHWDKVRYEKLLSSEAGNNEIMLGNVHYLGSRGVFYYDHVPYYTLKFWHGKLEGDARFLWHLSSFIKKKDDNIHELTNLISTYCYYTAEDESASAYLDSYLEEREKEMNEDMNIETDDENEEDIIE